jgi:hypothetical protein
MRLRELRVQINLIRMPKFNFTFFKDAAVKKQRYFSENWLVCHFITLKLSQNRINP